MTVDAILIQTQNNIIVIMLLTACYQKYNMKLRNDRYENTTIIGWGISGDLKRGSLSSETLPANQ